MYLFYQQFNILIVFFLTMIQKWECVHLILGMTPIASHQSLSVYAENEADFSLQGSGVHFLKEAFHLLDPSQSYKPPTPLPHSPKLHPQERTQN